MVKIAHRRRERAPGFTLIELMVVLVIAGMMLTLIPPLFSGAVPGARLKGSARDLVTLMRETRSRAILRNSEQQLQLNLESGQYRAGDDKPQSLPAGVTVSVKGAAVTDYPAPAQHALRFFPDGGTSGESVTLSDGTRSYRLQLDWLTGRVAVSEGARDDG